MKSNLETNVNRILRPFRLLSAGLLTALLAFSSVASAQFVPPLTFPASANTFENTPVDITLQASDVDSLGIRFMLNLPPDHGVVTGLPSPFLFFGPAEISKSWVAQYTPSAGYIGLDSFFFAVTDTHGNISTQLASLTILPAVAAIPEPSTYALMLAGLGFVGFVANRRRKAQTAAA